MSAAYTPIALFAYCRPQHIRQTIESLKANPGWQQHPITVYCDGAAGNADASHVMETRRVVRDMLGGHATIMEHEHNIGLSASLIHGITQQVTQHGRVIVLEDDLMLSSCALQYFTTMLDHYEHDERVMHIAGYAFPVDAPLPDLFFYRECSCWGWATWKRAWRHFNPDARALLTTLRAKGQMRSFNIDGTARYTDMLEQQMLGLLDSWAIRWYASVFTQGGLALHPGKSLVSNHGFDGSGIHCGRTTKYDVILSDTLPTTYPATTRELEQAVAAMKAYRIRHDYHLKQRLRAAARKLVVKLLPVWLARRLLFR